jgi:hypothetical protein
MEDIEGARDLPKIKGGYVHNMPLQCAISFETLFTLAERIFN